MELFYPSLFLLFVSLVSLPFFILFYRQVCPFTAPNLPPGSMGYPVIGESLAFLSWGWKGYPEKFFYERMTKYSSQVFKTSLFSQPTVILCGPECNKFLFSNENKLVRSWWLETVNKIFPSSLQTSSNEESRRMRRMLPQFLGPKALQCYVGIVDSVAQRHFASDWENKTEVTVFALAKRYTFSLACRLFMSVEDPNQIAKLAKFCDVIRQGVLSMPIDLPGTPFNRAIKASEFIREELLKMVKQRKVDLADGKASPTQDIFSHMLLICDEDGQYLSEYSIADKILGLLIGGDTASSACTFIVKFLAELPQNIYQQIYQEQMEIVKSKSSAEMLNWHDIEKMKYSWNVVCEVMRLAPPLQGAGFREAISDFVFNGFSIPKGWKLYWSAYSTHRNPEYFLEPEKFDPCRFSGGPRMCDVSRKGVCTNGNTSFYAQLGEEVQVGKVDS